MYGSSYRHYPTMIRCGTTIMFLCAMLLLSTAALHAQAPGEMVIETIVAKIKANDFAGALQACNHAIEQEGQGSRAFLLYYNRGIARTNLGDFPGAHADFDHAIQLKPDFDESYVQRALLFRKSHQADSALADLTRALQLNPKNGQALQLRGDVNFDLQHYDEAMADLNQAAVYSKDFLIYVRRGRIEYLLKKYDSAVDDYTRAIQIKPDVGEWYFFRGLCKALQKPDDYVHDACFDFGKAREFGYDLSGTGVENYCEYDRYER